MPKIGLEYGTGLPRKYAKQLFNVRTEKGFSLSAKIWMSVNYPIAAAWQEIQKGTSAVEIAKIVRPLLLRDGPAWTTGIKPSVTGKGTVAYNALRLARTEVNQAYHDAQNMAAEGNPLIKGMKWHLSGSHPERDICDDWAEENAHGLGPGIFPVGQTPKDHPNGLCFLTTIYHEPKELRARLEELYPAEISHDEATPLSLEKMKRDSVRAEELIGQERSEFECRQRAVQEIWNSMTKEEQERFLSYLGSKEATSKKAMQTIHTYIDRWGTTSGDSDKAAIALQLAAQEEFGLDGADIWWSETHISEARRYLDEGHREPMRMFLRKQYELTQAEFKKNGVDSITLYRGIGFRRHDKFRPSLNWDESIEQVRITMQPMSSYSSDLKRAASFSKNRQYSAIIAADVPVENILSWCITGQGTQFEKEFVVIPGVGHGEGFPQWVRSWEQDGIKKLPGLEELMEQFAKGK